MSPKKPLTEGAEPLTGGSSPQDAPPMDVLGSTWDVSGEPFGDWTHTLNLDNDFDYGFINPDSINTPEVLAEAPSMASDKIILELDVPVINADFNQEWNDKVMTKQEPDPMACFNPLDVEGKMLKIFETKKARKALPKLIMPKATTEQAQNLLDTPSIDSVLEKNVALSNFDLLEFVTNQELPVNDPSFLNMIGDISPKIIQPEIKVEVEVPTKGKKRRGRPPVASTSSTDHSYYESSSNLSTDDVKDIKYRRMRDLNNEASKRCRQNRKRKFALLQDEEDDLIKKNTELRKKCQHMEDLVGQLKRQFIEKITNPERPKIDLDELLSSRLSSMM